MKQQTILSRDPRTLTLHPAASLIPSLCEQEYADLLEDIRTHHIQVPLDVDGDIVLDGRHRLQIARHLRFSVVPVRQVSLHGESSLAYMLRMAVLRRHLTDDQRAAIAALWKQKHGRTVGRPQKNPHAVVGISAKMPAAAVPTLFNITRRKLDEATYLMTRAPHRFAAVHDGTLKLRELALSRAGL